MFRRRFSAFPVLILGAVLLVVGPSPPAGAELDLAGVTRAAQLIVTTLLISVLLGVPPGTGKVPSGEGRLGARHEVRYSAPAWSPDGRQNAFVEKSGESRPRIVISRADGSHPNRYSAGPFTPRRAGTSAALEGSSSFSNLTWSPGGRVLAFVEHLPLLSGSLVYIDRLCLLSVDGRHFRGVEIKAADIGALAWSPEGKRIAVAANRNVFPPGREKERRADLWIVEAATGRRRKLAACPGNVSGLSWSPTGGRLLFTARPLWDRTRAAVIGMTADGKGKRVLSRQPADRFLAAWSPGGAQVAYTVRAPGNSLALELAGLVSGTRRKLRSTPHSELLGVFWPTAGRIVTLAGSRIREKQEAPPSDQLRVDAIDARSGRSRVRLRVTLRTVRFLNTVAWTPRGDYAAFEGENSGSSTRIYRLDLRTGRVLDLTRKRGLRSGVKPGAGRS